MYGPQNKEISGQSFNSLEVLITYNGVSHSVRTRGVENKEKSAVVEGVPFGEFLGKKMCAVLLTSTLLYASHRL